MRLLLRHAKIINPATSLETTGDILIQGGIIQAMDSFLDIHDAEIMDCHGRALAPALIDLFALCPEPGDEHASMQDLSAQALRGGVGTVALSPEATPIRDLVAHIRYGHYRARESARCHLHFHGALTRGLEGRELADMGRLKEAGALTACNGLRSISSSRVMHRAMTHAQGLDVLVMHRPEDTELAEGGMAHRGAIATGLGLAGIPTEAETITLARDLQLQQATGAQYHALMLSTASAVQLLTTSNAHTPHVSASVALANLLLDDSLLEGFNTAAKTIPPLRGRDDAAALRHAIMEGTIRHICSGHHPFSPETKALPFAQASHGLHSLPYMLPVLVTLFHKQMGKSLSQALAPASLHNAELLGLPTGRMAVGAPADLVLFDPDAAAGDWMGHPLVGKVLCTFIGGKPAYHSPS